MFFEQENIVIGSSIDALLYGFANSYPVYFAECRKPFEFEYFDKDVQLENFHIADKEYLFGVPKIILWEKLFFLLSMQGLLPLSNYCDTIRHNGNSLSCSTEYEKLCEISFDKCYYFGDNKTYKLVNERKIKNARYKVYDRIGFNRGGKHDVDYLQTGDNFVREVWFYSSDRICGNTGVKDACVLSILTDEQLADNSYTQTMTSFKLIDLMKKNGMRGKFNGYNKYGTPRYYNFRTSHIDRSIFLMDQPEWRETDRIRKIDTSTTDLIKSISDIEIQKYDYINGKKL
jgi:hypothetical protein